MDAVRNFQPHYLSLLPQYYFFLIICEFLPSPTGRSVTIEVFFFSHVAMVNYIIFVPLISLFRIPCTSVTCVVKPKIELDS